MTVDKIGVIRRFDLRVAGMKIVRLNSSFHFEYGCRSSATEAG
jgi:hypothetical protein